MYLLRVNKKGYKVLHEGDISVLLSRLEEVSEQYEREGAFLVNKEQLDKATFHYEFATLKGWECALIIVGGIAGELTRS